MAKRGRTDDRGARKKKRSQAAVKPPPEYDFVSRSDLKQQISAKVDGPPPGASRRSGHVLPAWGVATCAEDV